MRRVPAKLVSHSRFMNSSPRSALLALTLGENGLIMEMTVGEGLATPASPPDFNSKITDEEAPE